MYMSVSVCLTYIQHQFFSCKPTASNLSHYVCQHFCILCTCQYQFSSCICQQHLILHTCQHLFFSCTSTIRVGMQWHMFVEVLCLKLEGLGFDSLGFFIDLKPFRRTVALRVDSASNRNEYKEYLLGGKRGRHIGLITLPPSYDNSLEVL